MNHNRVDISEVGFSCGVVQISRLSDEIDENLFTIANYFYHPARGNPPAFVMLSNLADVETNGHRLIDRIGKLKFGKVIVTSPEINPKTGHIILVWVWTVNHESFKNWYKATKIEKLRHTL